MPAKSNCTLLKNIEINFYLSREHVNSVAITGPQLVTDGRVVGFRVLAEL